MNLIKFDYTKGDVGCPKCGKDISCFECYAKRPYCHHCGATVELHDCYIILTTEKYHGWDEVASYVATLIIDGKDYATAHVKKTESDAGGDVAHLQLKYIPENMQTEVVAEIISAFAVWVRFVWENPDKQSTLPTLVRLMGRTIDKREPLPWRIESWVALPDARKIKPAHLAWEFTSKEVV